MTDSFAISAQDIVKQFGHKRALDGASALFESGKTHVLLGRNGSGKTTLARVLAGILKPDSGGIILDGLTETATSGAFRRHVGFMFDSSAHWESLTGWENAWFFARSYGLGEEVASPRLKSLFERFAMAEVAKDPVSSYSFGMKRKLALVQALAHEPSVLILDEPSIGLDHSSRTVLYDLVRALVRNGTAAIVATNDMNEARYMADVVSLIDRGRVLVTGAPDDLIRDLNEGVVVDAQLDIPLRVDGLASIPGVVRAAISEDTATPILHVMADPGNEQLVLTGLLSYLRERNIRVLKIEIRRPELGDVFMRFLKEGRDAAR